MANTVEADVVQIGTTDEYWYVTSSVSTPTWATITRSTEPMWRTVPHANIGNINANMVYYTSKQWISWGTPAEPEDPNMKLPEGF